VSATRPTSGEGRGPRRGQRGARSAASPARSPKAPRSPRGGTRPTRHSLSTSCLQPTADARRWTEFRATEMA
jgi:hypothetical protein